MWWHAAKKPLSNFNCADTLGFMQYNAENPRRCDCATFFGWVVGGGRTFEKVISKYLLKWDGY